MSACLGAQTPPQNIMPLMQEIVQALGVQCEYCHSAPRGSGQPEPKKDIARQMIAMTRDLNTRIQTATGKPATEAEQVKCVTCHHGVPIPRQLSEIVTQTLREKGVTAAVEQYRDLHQHFYGRAAYDFGEDTLIGVAQPLASGKPDDAIALLKLNLEFYPQSAKTYAAIGLRLHAEARRPDRHHVLRKSGRARSEQRSHPRAAGTVEDVPTEALAPRGRLSHSHSSVPTSGSRLIEMNVAAYHWRSNHAP